MEPSLVFIDHHHPDEKTQRRADMYYYDEESSSTVELILDLGSELGFDFDPKVQFLC